MKEMEFPGLAGVLVGHAGDDRAATGCTVVLCEGGATAGVDVRGGAPGTRETDLLNPVNLVDKIHAVCLAGGSAFGLDAASGVMRFLDERGMGFDVGVAKVPIVCGAVLFDLAVGDPGVRPDAEMGYRACLQASDGPPIQGSVGAGTGATVGKAMGMARAMKGGLGCAGLEVGDLRVGALVAVNCLGDVVDPETGGRLAGLRTRDGGSLEDSEVALAERGGEAGDLFAGNTSLGVVITNAAMTKAGASKVASMAHDGFARSMRPAHTLVDGDTIFALSVGDVPFDRNAVGFLAAKVVGMAVVSAVMNARTLAGVPARSDLFGDRGREGT